MLKKKGFTIVEALTVVVILGMVFALAIISASHFLQKDKSQEFVLASDVLRYIVDSNAVEVEYSTMDNRRIVVTGQDWKRREFKVDEGGYVMERLRSGEYGEWMISSSYGEGGLIWQGQRKRY